ncbi:MAG TPA: agmatine deiminase family protein [Acidisarcina sp.]
MEIDETPAQNGFMMPAEWAPHAATWIAWPHNPADWPGKFQPIPWVYAEIVRHLSAVEDVQILVENAASEKKVRSILSRSGADVRRIHYQHWPTNRVWVRDSGPIFVRKTAEGGVTGNQATIAVTNWKFNAWAKYNNWQLDDQIPWLASKLLKLPEWKPVLRLDEDTLHRLVLEGGSIDVNGAGTLITTEECLLSKVQERNPGVSREQLEQAFHDYLGVRQVLWLNRGCAGDDTHGHVDDVTRFVAENVIVTATETDTSDENHLPLAENLDRLKSARNLKGKPFRIVELPMPSPVSFAGQRLPASYCNFYIANGLLLVPTFNDVKDRQALNILAELFPSRNVIGIYCGDLIWGLGALHCMTQQQPA